MGLWVSRHVLGLCGGGGLSQVSVYREQGGLASTVTGMLASAASLGSFVISVLR